MIKARTAFSVMLRPHVALTELTLTASLSTPAACPNASCNS